VAHKNKSLLLLFFRKEESSFLKERGKEFLLLWLSLPAPRGVSNYYLPSACCLRAFESSWLIFLRAQVQAKLGQ
jgi:hypothetical protein